MLRRESEHRNVPYVFLNAISTGLIVPYPKTMEQIPSCCYPPPYLPEAGYVYAGGEKVQDRGGVHALSLLTQHAPHRLPAAQQSINQGWISGGTKASS